MPDKIARLESEISDLENQMSDPDLYSRDPHGFEKISRTLHHARAELNSAEEEWLELEMLRAEIEETKKPA